MNEKSQQTIFGNHNVQLQDVDGTVVIGGGPIIDPNDPDIVVCPFGCGQQTWWNREHCWNCGRPVLDHFRNLEWQERRKVLLFRCLLSIGLGVACVVVGQYLPRSFTSFTSVLGVIFIAFAFINAKAAE